MSLFLDRLRSTDLYRKLCGVIASDDGNLLEQTNDQLAEAQVEFLRWALQMARPRLILETGTDKGFFGYLLSWLLEDAELHTFDIRPEAERVVALLNAEQHNLRCFFYLGDSRESLLRFTVPVQFAWIDGGQSTDAVISDLLQCYRLRVPYVAVDDTAYRPVRKAIDYVQLHLPYRGLPSPFEEGRRRAILLRLERQPSDTSRQTASTLGATP